MIRAANLTRRFGERVAVDGVTFDVGAGEVFALLGPNGAGKTTTLRMLAGLLPASGGSVAIDGTLLTRATAQALRGRIGLLTESPGLWDRLTVFANLLVYARLYGLADAPRRVERTLRSFELWNRRGDLAALLSKGMKQRLALARALLHDPPIVLLDEPTAGLDPVNARRVRELVLDLRQSGRAVIVSTHNLDEAERLADRVAVLQHRLVAVDRPEHLRRRLFGHRLRVRIEGDAAPLMAAAATTGVSDVRREPDGLSMTLSDPARQTPLVVRAVVEAGGLVRAVYEEEPALEEVYLRLLQPRNGE